MNWPFGTCGHLSAPWRNSRKFKRSSFGVYLHLSLPANDFDGKSDGKIFLRVLFRSFTVKPIPSSSPSSLALGWIISSPATFGGIRQGRDCLLISGLDQARQNP